MERYRLELTFRGPTGVKRRATAWTRAANVADAKLHVLAEISASHGGQRAVFTAIDHADSRIYIEGLGADGVVVKLKDTTHWRFDSEARHAGRNKHKKGKLVPFAAWEKTQRRRARRARSD